MTTTFRGVIPPIVTPLTSDRHLDVASLERSINRMINAGVHGLFVLGSSGETAFLTDAGRREVLEATVAINAGRLPILAGVIDMQTERVATHAAIAAEVGVDALVATAPFYGLGGPIQVERHFRVLAERFDLPLFAYDIPVSVHAKLNADMLVELGRQGVLAGVKDSSGDDVNFRYLTMRNRDAGSPLTLLTGHEVVVDGAYLSGADGCVPGLGNVAPAGYVRQWEAYQRGDWEAVRREQDLLAKLMTITAVSRTAVGFGAGVGAFKTALQLLDVFDTNQMTEPVAALEGEDAAAIAAVLQETGMLGG